MSSYPPKETSVFIVGASVFGLSTALHLAQAGYSDITVFDRAETIPSPFAASNDLNKIVRAEYGSGHCEDDFYTRLSLKAIKAWLSSQWSDCYREVGYVRLAESEGRKEPIRADADYFSKTRLGEELWFPNNAFRELKSKNDIQGSVPQLVRAEFGSNWQGYLNTYAGYALASKAILSTYNQCRNLGIKFILGSGGHITKLETEGKSADIKQVVAIKTANGAIHRHPEGVPHITILSVGAYLSTLLPIAGEQVTAKSWSVGHLKLTKEEATALQNTPVMNLSELGFWMEPLWTSNSVNEPRVTLPSQAPSLQAEEDEGEYLLKLAAHGGGWTNFVQLPDSDTPISIPPSHPLTSIPPSDEVKLRLLIKASLPPHFHERPLIHKTICWCADTADSEYVIDFVPGYKHLVLAGADSGHAFKMLPIAGQWVKELLETGEQRLKRWRWKQVEEEERGGKLRTGWDNVAWRSGKVTDLRESGIECKF